MNKWVLYFWFPVFESPRLLRTGMLPVNVRVKLPSSQAEERHTSDYCGKVLFHRELQNPSHVPWWMALMGMMPTSLGNRLLWSKGFINCFKTGIPARPWQGQADEIHLNPEPGPSTRNRFVLRLRRTDSMFHLAVWSVQLLKAMRLKVSAPAASTTSGSLLKNAFSQPHPRLSEWEK